MGDKGKNAKPINKYLYKILKFILILSLSFIAIKTGMIFGNTLYKSDIRIVENTDVEKLKKNLSISVPLIDVVYNSGEASVSVLNDFKSFMSSIFKFDLHNPVTLLNAQTPVFEKYYYTSYIPSIEKKRKEAEQLKIAEAEIDDEIEQKEIKEFKEDASSITLGEEGDKKEYNQGGEVSSGKISIFNETKYKIGIDSLLSEALKLKFNKSGPKILVYHTHTTESYINNLKDLNNKNIPNWTTDPSYNVVRVGEEITQLLRKKYDIDVIHNGTVHDSNYNKSYVASLKTVEQYLKSYPSIGMTIDVHRDGLGTNGTKLRVVKNIKGRNAAQVMFVMGTDARLSHPYWKENLKLAIKLQAKLNEIAPGLAKPIYISKNRYNEHVTKGSLIIEVGGDGNLLSECLESTKYLAQAINEVVFKK